MTTRGKHDKEIDRRRARRTASAGLKAVVVQHNQGFTEGGLTPEEINGENTDGTIDFTSIDARVDRTSYRGVRLAPGYQDGNKPADYRKG
jgi:hypothetical protein